METSERRSLCRRIKRNLTVGDYELSDADLFLLARFLDDYDLFRGKGWHAVEERESLRDGVPVRWRLSISWEFHDQPALSVGLASTEPGAPKPARSYSRDAKHIANVLRDLGARFEDVAAWLNAG